VNIRSRAVKASKLHFVDTGLACHLLGIRTPEQLALHPLRGALFETWVASEVLKARLHAGRPPDLFHLREDRGMELDLLAETRDRVYGVAVKSAATLAPDFFRHLAAFPTRIAKHRAHPRLVYGGDRRETREGVEVIPWTDIQTVAW